MLQPVPAGVGRAANDRGAWDPLAATDRYRDVVRQAVEIAGRDIPAQPDDLYLDFSRTGNRDNWQAVAFQRRRELAVLALAECLENRGRFVPKVRVYLDALCAEPTWVWPAHDRALRNFRGEVIEIDLGAAELAWQMATVRWLLADRLPPEAHAMVVDNVRRRIVEPFLAAASGKAKPIGWATRTNNWNAVCHAGVVGAALATVDDRTIRAAVVAAAERDIGRFLDGFGPDGYCSEGLGYWNYGFGHFVLLAETVRAATAGRLDLMARPAVRPMATFAARIQIRHGVSPAFADCAVNATPAPQLIRYVNGRFGLGMAGAERPPIGSERFYLYEEAVHAFLEPAPLPAPPAVGAGPPSDSPLRSWFGHAGVLVGRPAPGSACRIGVALKGGHNAEQHNHNDLGSFVVVLDAVPILLDPGHEHYTARTFGPRRYEGKLLNSFGHPVPVVAGQLQRAGAAARAEVVRTEFTDATDTLVLDLTSAYPVPELKRLERTFVYDRRGAGTLTVTDRVTFTTPQPFGTALVTLGRLIRQDGDTLVIGDGASDLACRVDAGGAAFRVDAETIRDHAPVTPTRVGIQLTEPGLTATVTVTISPPEPVSR